MDGRSLASTFLILLLIEWAFLVVGQTTVQMIETTQVFETTRESNLTNGQTTVKIATTQVFETTRESNLTNGQTTVKIATTQVFETTRESNLTNGQTTVKIGTTQVFETTRESNLTNGIKLALRPNLSIFENAVSVRVFIDVTANFISTSDVETIQCEFSFTDGSTTGSSDYGPVASLQSQTFTIAADTSLDFFDIQIVNNEIVENDETFEVILTSCVGNDVTITTTNGMTTTTVTIQDDDAGINLALRPSVTVSESAGVAQIFIDVIANFASASNTETIQCDFSFTDGTTTGNSDYGPVAALQSQTFTIAAGTSVESFNIQITNDEIVESDETFDVILTSCVGNSVNITTTNGMTTTTVTIQDDDADINLALRPSVTVSESTGVVQIFIDVMANFASASDVETIQCGFSFTNDSTTGISDYGPVAALQSQTFTIAAGTSVESFNIQITNDEIVESDETFDVILTSCVGNDVTITTTNGMTTTTVSIQDDDTADITIADGTGSGGSISQNSNHAVVTISSSSAFEDDVTIDLQYSGYTDIFSGTPPSSVVLPAGSTSQTINIPLVSERDEGTNFTVTATAPPNNPPVTISQPNLTFTTAISTSTAVTPVSIGFSSASYFVSEGDTIRIQLTSSGPVPMTVEAGIVITGNVNDIIIENTARFPAGQSIAFVSATAVSDSVQEARETLVLSIDPASLPSGFVVDPNSATAMIVITDATMSPIGNTPSVSQPMVPTGVVQPSVTASSTTPPSASIIAGIIVGLLAVIFSILSVACCCLYCYIFRPARSKRSYDVTPYYKNPNFILAPKRYIDEFYF